MKDLPNPTQKQLKVWFRFAV